MRRKTLLSKHVCVHHSLKQTLLAARVRGMDLDHFKNAIRDALRPELEKLAARGDSKAELDAVALTDGAKWRLLERTMGFEPIEIANPYFEVGRRLADDIPV
jgi:hypothetical protein